MDQFKIFLTLTLLLCIAATGQAQKFYAEVSAQQVELGDNLRVGFTWENMQVSNFKPPAFKNFDLISGPSTSSRSSSVNGRMSTVESKIYTVTPKKPGKWEIGSATIIHKGQTYKSQPVTINVVKGLTSSVPINDQVLARAQVTDTVVYIGQQILLEYKLYSLTGRFSSPQFQSSPSFDGFYAVNIPLGKKQTTTEKLDGKDYYVQTFTKVALFPQQTGTYQIEPVQLNFRVEVLTKNGKKVISKAEHVPAIDIQVKDLPPTTEPQTGAVGRYKIKVECDQRRITTDKAIVVNMFILGNGDPNQIKAPKWDLPDGLEMYDPNVTEGNPNTEAYGISHYKNFEYLIVAKEPGRYQLNPSFTYYDTDSSAYVTLNQKLPPITVLQGSNMEEVATPKARQELAGIVATTQLKKPSTPLHNSALHLLSLLGTLLGGMGIFAFGRKLEKSGKYDAASLRKNNAFSVAQQRLEKSKSHLDKNESKEFHEEMIVALKTYITDKYDIPALHLKKPELFAQLSSHLSAEALEDFKILTQKSEVAMYAPASQSNMSETYELAINFIAQAEK